MLGTILFSSLRHYNLIYVSISFALDLFPKESFGRNASADTLYISTSIFSTDQAIIFDNDFLGETLVESLKEFKLRSNINYRVHKLDLSLVLEGADNLNSLSVSLFYFVCRLNVTEIYL